MRKLLILAIALLLCLPSLTAVASSTESTYYFTYYYTNASGDSYSGYVYAPTGWYSTGATLNNQPGPMGGASLGSGYYYITSVTDGYDTSYDAEESIMSYYDANTAKTSFTLYSGTGGASANVALYVADRQTTAESGYAYDPSVPSTDSYFGNSDVCYSFSTSSNAGDFLAYYISDMPYWQEPTSYANSGAEVATAELLAADEYQNPSATKLITTDTNWQTDWTNGTQNTTSYVTLIGELATDMGWTSSSGTKFNNIGSGLMTYLNGQGVLVKSSTSTTGFTYNSYDVTAARSADWSTFETDIFGTHGGSEILELAGSAYSSTGYEYGAAKGYWNDGHVVVEAQGSNHKINWNATSDGGTYSTAEVVGYVDFYYQN